MMQDLGARQAHLPVGICGSTAVRGAGPCYAGISTFTVGRVACCDPVLSRLDLFAQKAGQSPRATFIGRGSLLRFGGLGRGLLRGRSGYGNIVINGPSDVSSPPHGTRNCPVKSYTSSNGRTRSFLAMADFHPVQQDFEIPAGDESRRVEDGPNPRKERPPR